MSLRYESDDLEILSEKFLANVIEQASKAGLEIAVAAGFHREGVLHMVRKTTGRKQILKAMIDRLQ